MKQALNALFFENTVKLILGDTTEIELFLQTTIDTLGIDPYIDDTDSLIATLDEQIKVLFSPSLQVAALDADTHGPASKRSEEIILAVLPIDLITVH